MTKAKKKIIETLTKYTNNKSLPNYLLVTDGRKFNMIDSLEEAGIIGIACECGSIRNIYLIK